MKTFAWVLLLFPVALAVARLITCKYIFSALTTASCLVVVCVSGASGWAWVAAGLLASIVGDYFMNRERGFLYGIMGFFCAHMCFLGFAIYSFGALNIYCILTAALMCVCFIAFLALRIYPREPSLPIKIALTMYMLISVSVFALSMCASPYNASALAFTTGIFMIVFSDTLIGFDKYLKIGWAGKWVLPTYYACHVLIALALVLRM